MSGDPMDMFEEMDEMFARLFTRMDGEFMNGTGESGTGLSLSMGEMPLVWRKRRAPGPAMTPSR